jgi:hypothetical protein
MPPALAFFLTDMALPIGFNLLGQRLREASGARLLRLADGAQLTEL